jgi:4-amino-4-deoxy-L-arabinose transferase-like glycosyltransferase
VIFRYTCGYTLLFSLLAWLNRYDIWLGLPPVSIHQWRQADGASIAWHYAQNPNFWEVSVCNLFSTGDAHAVGELPLLYWLAGLVSHHWNFPAYPLRWIGLLLLFVGCWAFGWTILQLTKRPTMAVLGSGLLLTSPVLSYYGPSFLPDAPAFCFVLMMLACLFQANEKQSRGWLVAAGVTAALAILLKLSMAIVPITLAITWLLGKWRRHWLTASIWNSRWPVVVAVAAAGVISGFRWWMMEYNAAHQATYFLTATRPIWNYDWPFIKETFIMMGTLGLPAFASAGLYLASLGGLWLSLKHWKSNSFEIRSIFTFTILGSAAYMLLWFRMLREHDYYFICLLVVPAFLLLNGLRLAMPRYTEKRLVYGLTLCLLLGILHEHHIMSKRLRLAFQPETSLNNLPPDAFFSPDDNLSIPQSARVFCPQDPSPNIALFALQRHGWTAYNFGDRITADTLQKYQTQFGLSHLALRDTAIYSPLFQRFFPTKVGVAKGWHFYERGL